MKRKKEADEWKSRWFVLSHDYLSYYLAYQVKNLIAYTGVIMEPLPEFIFWDPIQYEAPLKYE